MIGQTSGHGRGALLSLVTRSRRSSQAEKVVRRDKVVGAANQVQTRCEDRPLTQEGSAPTNQRDQGRPEGSVEALDVGGVDALSAPAG